MKYTPILTPKPLTSSPRYPSEHPPALVPRDSATFRLAFETPDGARASIAVEGTPAWVWFLAGAGTVGAAAILIATISRPKRRRGRP